MTVIVVDFRQTRRLGVAKLSRAGNPEVFDRYPGERATMPRPCLALWHVGYDQNKVEAGQLRRQLDSFLTAGPAWIAAYTGGPRPDALVPTDGDHFVVRSYVGADEDPSGDFSDAIRSVVTRWASSGGAFAPWELRRLWLGRDPFADSKPVLLTALEAGHEPPEEALAVLRGVYPTIDADVEAVRRGTPGALEALWRLLYR